MSKTFSPAEAKDWVESRAWANGCKLTADETIDAVEFATQYHRNPEIWEKLFAFLAETDPKTLETGKIEIVPGRLWINVLAPYTPKSAEETKTENHKHFIDLQYTFEGDELYGLADIEAVKPTIDYDPVKDRTFYTLDPDTVYVPAAPDRFFLYFPADLHQPSVRASETPGVNRKLVGKIEYID